LNATLTRRNYKEEFCPLDIMPYSPLKINRRFGGTRISQARNQHEVDRRLRKHAPPKRLLAVNGLHGVISQKI
jgi:hypothetical protein